jgi:LEA14-like dessication related protein
MKLLPIALISGLAYLYLNRKVFAGKNLVVEPNDIAIDTEKTRQSLFTRIYYRVRLNLVNSESAAVVVRNVQLQASSDGTDLGTLTAAGSFTVPARSSKIVQLDAAVSSFGLISTILNIVRNGRAIQITVKGFVDTDLGRIPVEFVKSVQAPTL